ncbi:hypothetical protein [Streptomyces sp. NPDC059552]|uniref:hypothetical protein n=1 Tax=Streptomyces sp. NPDC059552 TaxID=3346862 RepID=UPI003691639A
MRPVFHRTPHQRRRPVSLLGIHIAPGPLPLLRRLAHALDAGLNIALDGDHEEVTFIAHPAA